VRGGKEAFWLLYICTQFLSKFVATFKEELDVPNRKIPINTMKPKSKSLCSCRPVGQSVCLGVEPHLGLMTRF
jgi:hypothetical protein